MLDDDPLDGVRLQAQLRDLCDDDDVARLAAACSLTGTASADPRPVARAPRAYTPRVLPAVLLPNVRAVLCGRRMRGVSSALWWSDLEDDVRERILDYVRFDVAAQWSDPREQLGLLPYGSAR